MTVQETPLGYKQPDGLTELAKRGAELIAHNAAKNQEHIAGLQSSLGRAMALINSGAGGPGVSEDPDHPGLYYFAGPAFWADPAHPGLYFFQEETP